MRQYDLINCTTNFMNMKHIAVPTHLVRVERPVLGL